VIGFLRRLFGRKDGTGSVEKLRAKWQRKKSPTVAEDLAKALLREDKLEEAFQVVKEAYRLFPRAERVRACYYHVLRLRSTDEVRQLRQAIATDGRPELYARLAELYRYLGRFEEALDVARQGVERHPDFPGAHLALGRIHYTRFLKTAAARDGKLAAESLERAVEVDPDNFKALYHLVNLYLTVGDGSRAARYLDQLAKIAPGDSRVQELSARLEQLPEGAQDSTVDYFTRYETAHLREPVAPTFQLKKQDELAPLVAELAAAHGVREVAVLDHQGTVIAAAPPEGGAVGPVISQIVSAARNGARRMSIGSFVQGTVTCKNMKIFLRDLEGNAVAVVTSKDAGHDTIQLKLSQFAAACISVPERS